MTKHWVPLERVFAELEDSRSAIDWDYRESSLRYSGAKLFSWSDLLSRPRVVLLGQPGSGKSEECEQAVRRLREAGRTAFYLRLEDIERDGMPMALRAADMALFETWNAGSGPGTFVLDSVDETRLHGGSLARALRRFAHGISGAHTRANVIVTSRPQDWRGEADLAVLKEELPAPPTQNIQEVHTDAPYTPGTTAEAAVSSAPPVEPKPLTVYLLGLTREQVQRFVEENGVDAEAFAEALTEAEAWGPASRPLDLIQLIALWEDERRLGSPGELLEKQIMRLVAEMEPDRAKKSPYSPLEVKTGVQRLAAAMELGRCSAIAVPDKDVVGSETLLDPRRLFPDRDERFVAASLSARVFDPESVGKVRFHHRKTREFLAASWFRTLLEAGKSRTAIERVFFRPGLGGRRVVPPSLRPTIGWVASFHGGVARAAIRHCPDALLLEGDPALLSPDLRSRALDSWVDAAEAGRLPLESLDFAQLRRFAAPELAPVINRRLVDAKTPERARLTLLSIVAEGKLEACAEAAATVAVSSNFSWNEREQALDAVANAGTPVQRQTVVTAALAEPELSDWFAATLTRYFLGSELTAGQLETLLRATKRRRKPYVSDYHVTALANWFREASSVSEVRLVLSVVVDMLFRRPVEDQHEGVPLNSEHTWLAPAAKSGALRLFREGQPKDDLFFRAVLAGLTAEARHEVFDESLRSQMAPFFAQPAFRRSLFDRTVASVTAEPESPFLDAHRARETLGGYLPEDRTWLAEVIGERPGQTRLQKAALVALLRFLEAPPAPSDDVRSIVNDETELLTFYNELVTPRPLTREERKYKNYEAKMALQKKRAQAKTKAKLRESIAVLKREAGQIRSGTGPGALIWARNWLTHHPPAGSKLSTRYGELSYPDLVSVFGVDVAAFLEEGYRAYWRREHPPLPGDYPPNTTPYSAILGLIGLWLDHCRDPNFVAGLTPEEAQRATRYALWELNGFPSWFEGLVQHHHNSVESELSQQIDRELAHVADTGWIPWTLHRIFYADDALTSAFSNLVLTKLEGALGTSAQAARAALKIVLSHSDDRRRVLQLVERALRYLRRNEKRWVWLAALVRLDAEKGAARLQALLNRELPTGRTPIIMAVAAEVMDLHGLSGKGLPQNHLSPAGARALLNVLTQTSPPPHQEHREEDEEHENAGRRLGARDEAEEFRNLIINAVADAPGEASVRLLLNLAEHSTSPSETARLSGLAERRSRLDAEGAVWAPEEVFGFEHDVQRAASNALDLGQRCLDLLDDIADEIQFSELFPTTSWQRADEETNVSDLLVGDLRLRNKRNWSITREEEVKNLKRPDLRVREGAIGPVAIEVKIADRWTLAELKAALTDQLIGQYMLGEGNVAGLLVFVTQGSRAASLSSRRRLEVTYDELEEQMKRLTETEAGKLGTDNLLGFRMLRADRNVGQRLRKPRANKASGAPARPARGSSSTPA